MSIVCLNFVSHYQLHLALVPYILMTENSFKIVEKIGIRLCLCLSKFSFHMLVANIVNEVILVMGIMKVTDSLWT